MIYDERFYFNITYLLNILNIIIHYYYHNNNNNNNNDIIIK
jgi:hypothetical protein